MSFNNTRECVATIGRALTIPLTAKQHIQKLYLILTPSGQRVASGQCTFDDAIFDFRLT